MKPIIWEIKKGKLDHIVSFFVLKIKLIWKEILELQDMGRINRKQKDIN